MGQRFNAPRMAVETWPTYIKTTTNQPPTVSHQASFSFSGLKMRSITATKSSRNSANSTIYPFNKLRKVALFEKELRDFTDSLRDIHNKTDKIPDFLLFVLRCTLFRRILLVLVSARLFWHCQWHRAARLRSPLGLGLLVHFDRDCSSGSLPFTMVAWHFAVAAIRGENPQKLNYY